MFRATAAGAAGVGAVAMVGASAALLGAVAPSSLAADVAVVASCDTDGIDVAWSTPVYNSATPGYDVATVTFSNVDAACDTLSYTLDLLDVSDASLVQDSGTVSLTASAFSVTLSPAEDVEPVEGLALAIYD